MAANPRIVAKIEAEEPAQRLALLIDADNAQAAVLPNLLAEIARFGEATVKRIYGDFTAPASAQWKKVLNAYAIKPVQQFAYTSGKNATDSTLIIDAMDLLYTRRFDGFCLVSSDSDFTGLAMRIREEGLMVYGFGEQKTPEAFRNACHKFVFTEVLRPTEREDAPAEKRRADSRKSAAESVAPVEERRSAAGAKPQAQAASSPPEEASPTPKDGVPGAVLPIDLFLQAIELSSDEQGWSHLGLLGSHLTKLRPDFDSRNFGYRKLSDLVRAHPELFVLDERKVDGSPSKVPYIRAKEGGGG